MNLKKKHGRIITNDEIITYIKSRIRGVVSSHISQEELEQKLGLVFDGLVTGNYLTSDCVNEFLSLVKAIEEEEVAHTKFWEENGRYSLSLDENMEYKFYGSYDYSKMNAIAKALSKKLDASELQK